MSRRLIQLLGSTEELWYFPADTKDEEIIKLYEDFEEQLEENGQYETFEEWIEHHGKWAAVAERVFVDEIYV